MININWLDEVQKRKENLIQDTQHFLKIKSVYDPESITENAPFGKGIEEALTFLLKKGQEAGFQTKNVNGYAGHLEIGSGESLIGILCHIDVVPEGDGWTSDPFGAERKDDIIVARGALDDKAPTMAIVYALKLISELNLPLSKRVRLIIGTDEERNWECVNHYFQKEEMPSMGFAPDADFPIINAEKGICDITIQYDSGKIRENGDKLLLESFQAGSRLNMVPELAVARISNYTDMMEIASSFNEFLAKRGIKGTVKEYNNEIELTVKGVSAHGSLPEKGQNAGILLAGYLQTLPLDGHGKQLISFLHSHFWNDVHGGKLGISFKDEISGPLTVNVGIIQYSCSSGGKIGFTIRYPVSMEFEIMRKKIDSILESTSLTIDSLHHLKPHYVPKEHQLVQILQKVYEDQTGEEASLMAIGGGTYARALQAGVAFGPLFPGRPEVAHQKDEFIQIDDLLKATAIYAQAIYELAK